MITNWKYCRVWNSWLSFPRRHFLHLKTAWDSKDLGPKQSGTSGIFTLLRRQRTNGVLPQTPNLSQSRHIYGSPLQYSCLENPMDEGTWWEAVYGVTKSWARLSDFTFTFQFHALEKEMATHSSILAWKIPWTKEPGRLQSKGSQRVRHDWATSLYALIREK